MTVTTQCADNAHVINSTSLNVTCTSNGTWVGQTPQCQCDDGCHEIRVNGTQTCQGKHKSTEKTFELREKTLFFVLRVFKWVYATSLANVFPYPIYIILDENTPRLHDLVELPTLISTSVVSLFLVILSLTTTIVVICLCRMKRSKKKPEDDEQTGNVPTKAIPCTVQNKMAIPVMPSCAYAYNVSRLTKVPVHSNEAHAVFNGVRREHKLTEDRKDTSKQGKTHTVLPYAVFEIIPLSPGVKKPKGFEHVTMYPTKDVPVYPNEAYSVCKGVTRQ